ncbi:MAG: response regulator transcription factor [Gammaproteobacteria bacterium]|nr:response regulator transcription factor [Gammaproteobacteria bacterium]
MKFLIADDHHLIREGLKNTLESVYNDLLVVEAKDGGQVVEMVENNPDLDLILLDYFMPLTDGFSLVTTLCDRFSSIPVIVISASDDPALMHKVLDRGVAGFIPKATNQELIVRAIQLVLSGGTYIPPELMEPVNAAVNGANTISTAPVEGSIVLAESAHMFSRLTHRQQEVLRLLAKGETNKDISRHLNVSENTVKVHVTAILKALGVSNRTQAVIVSQKMGLSG